MAGLCMLVAIVHLVALPVCAVLAVVMRRGAP